MSAALFSKKALSVIDRFGFPIFVVLVCFGAIGAMWNSDRKTHQEYMNHQYQVEAEQRADFTKALDSNNSELKRISSATNTMAKGVESSAEKQEETNRLLQVLVEQHEVLTHRKHAGAEMRADPKYLPAVREPSFDGGVRYAGDLP